MKLRVLIVFLIIIFIIGCTKNAIKPEKMDNTSSDASNKINSIENTPKIEELEEEGETDITEAIQEGDTTQREDTNNIILEQLKAHGLPLAGDNIFDPKKINIGDIIGGFILLNIEYVEATESYPFDTVVAKFEGETIITGAIFHTELDRESLADKVLFIADEKSINQLPISHHDVRMVDKSYTYIFLINQEDVKEKIKTRAGLKAENVQLKIKDYIVIYQANDLMNTATFVELID